jgi:hypothetical protein
MAQRFIVEQLKMLTLIIKEYNDNIMIGQRRIMLLSTHELLKRTNTKIVKKR